MHRITPGNAFTWDAAYGGHNYNLTAFADVWASYWKGRKTPFGLRNTTFTAIQVGVAKLVQF